MYSSLSLLLYLGNKQQIIPKNKAAFLPTIQRECCMVVVASTRMHHWIISDVSSEGKDEKNT